MIIAFNKPFGVLSQFTSDSSTYRTLSDFNFPKGVYPLGRLDAASEGLLLLSDEKHINNVLLHPDNAHKRTYWVQVEGAIQDSDLLPIRKGTLSIQGRKLLPGYAEIVNNPDIEPRNPPIRVRKYIPDSWISLTLIEGKNRQVRRMTAAIGYPTLRLIRIAIGNFMPNDIKIGTWREITSNEFDSIFA